MGSIVRCNKKHNTVDILEDAVYYVIIGQEPRKKVAMFQIVKGIRAGRIVWRKYIGVRGVFTLRVPVGGQPVYQDQTCVEPIPWTRADAAELLHGLRASMVEYSR